MSILVNQATRVLVQGITGREGSARTRLMVDYGTQVLAGVTPGRAGESVLGRPVYDTVQEAVENHGPFDASVIFVPAPLVKESALEAIDAGVRLVVLVSDRVPVYDTMLIVEAAQRNGTRVIGPNTLGLISPGKALLGMIGGSLGTAAEYFRPGPVGVMSRSGGMTSATCYYMSTRGIGQSTAVHVGGDGIIGSPFPDLLDLFEADPETRALALFGEIGGSQEERVAEAITAGRFTKPVVAFVSGQAAKSGARFSHAGAMVEGHRGSYAAKVAALRDAGVTVVTRFDELPDAVAEVLRREGVAGDGLSV